MDFTDLLKNNKNDFFLLEIDFFIHVYGEWTDDDFLILKQN